MEKELKQGIKLQNQKKIIRALEEKENHKYQILGVELSNKQKWKKK